MIPVAQKCLITDSDSKSFLFFSFESTQAGLSFSCQETHYLSYRCELASLSGTNFMKRLKHEKTSSVDKYNGSRITIKQR